MTSIPEMARAWIDAPEFATIATINPGAASKVAFGTQPSSAAHYAAITPAVTVRIEEIDPPRLVSYRWSNDDAAGSLPLGTQRIVEIARAMMLDPRVILMDEPSMGLDPKARRAVFQTIRDLNDADVTVHYVLPESPAARAGRDLTH